MQPISAVILEPRKIKSVTVSTFFPSIYHEMMELDAVILDFFNAEFQASFFTLLFVTPWTVVHQASLSMRILQARILEWVAMPSSRGSSQPRDQIQVSHIVGGFFTI